jgi:ribosomal protein S18 acetylase RimI-like enzyme
MSNEVIVRPYVDADYEQVKLNLEEADIFDSGMDTREILKEKVKQNPGSILVAQIDNNVVGNVYIIDDAWFSGIFRLAVRKEHRGGDVGRILMQKAEQYLKDKGHSEVMIFVNDKYDRLINWYKKQGYQHTDNKFKALWKKL